MRSCECEIVIVHVNWSQNLASIVQFFFAALVSGCRIADSSSVPSSRVYARLIDGICFLQFCYSPSTNRLKCSTVIIIVLTISSTCQKYLHYGSRKFPKPLLVEIRDEAS